MASDLRSAVLKISLCGDAYKSTQDREYAAQLCARHSLQAMLENVSSFQGAKVPKSVKDQAGVYLRTVSAIVDDSPSEFISTFIYGFNHPETFCLCAKSLRTICGYSEAKTFEGRECPVYDAADFEGVADRAVLVMNLLKTLLSNIVTLGRNKKELDHKRALLQVCYVSIFLLSQHMTSNMWTSNKSEDCAQQLLHLLVQETCCTAVTNLLMLDTKYLLPNVQRDTEYNAEIRKSILGKLLQQWKPCLERNTWKHHPTTIASFVWCLKQMVFPNLSPFIELMLPAPLLFMDDHMVENKTVGTECLIHILQNTGSEELRWFSRAEVIYSALKLQLLSTEETLLPLTQDALLLVLKVLVKQPDELGVATKYDEILCTILQAARHENKLALRRIHTKPLHIFIEVLGINSVKYSKGLIEIFEEYLEISDAPSEIARINTLLAVKSYIRVAYPRIQAHCTDLLKILVKLLHEISKNKWNITESVKQELISECKQCIELLRLVDDSSVTKSLLALKELAFTESCKESFQSLLDLPTLDG